MTRPRQTPNTSHREAPLRLRDVALLTLWAFWGAAALAAASCQQRWDTSTLAKAVDSETAAKPSVIDELLARPSCGAPPAKCGRTKP